MADMVLSGDSIVDAGTIRNTGRNSEEEEELQTKFRGRMGGCNKRNRSQNKGKKKSFGKVVEARRNCSHWGVQGPSCSESQCFLPV